MAERGSHEVLKRRWEERALAQGDTLAGVLCRGLPEAVNDHLHRWHATVIREALLPRVARGGRVLDVGCGYGRVARVLCEARGDLGITGMDFAFPYCVRFRSNTPAPAVCADIHRPPFAPQRFDALVAVTALMYVAPGRRAEVMEGLLALLRPGGHALLIDPGLEFMRLASLAVPSTRGTPTGGAGFTLGQYDRLGGGRDRRVVARGALPALSLALPLLQLLARRGRDLSPLLARIGRIDRRLGGWRRLSLHRWMLVQRRGRD